MGFDVPDGSNSGGPLGRGYSISLAYTFGQAGWVKSSKQGEVS